MGLLILGFGIQIGMWQYIRQGLHLKNKEATIAAGTGAGTSTTAMIACCAHHLADILPILGLSAASIFFSKYQAQLFAFGVLANIVGIAMMINVIRKTQC